MNNQDSNTFNFHGNGNEYFKIWIVNLMLSIVTIGIYTAWAKVRTNRYFYGNTSFKGHRFDYLASPITILKGRIIAIIFLGLYVVGANYSPIAGAVVAILLLIATPWIIYPALFALTPEFHSLKMCALILPEPQAMLLSLSYCGLCLAC